MESLFYDINRTYEENYKRGPVGLAKLKANINTHPEINTRKALEQVQKTINE